MFDTTYDVDAERRKPGWSKTFIFYSDFPEKITVPINIEREIERMNNLWYNRWFICPDTSCNFIEEEKALKCWREANKLCYKLKELAADYEKKRAVYQAELDILEQI